MIGLAEDRPVVRREARVGIAMMDGLVGLEVPKAEKVLITRIMKMIGAARRSQVKVLTTRTRTMTGVATGLLTIMGREESQARALILTRTIGLVAQAAPTIIGLEAPKVARVQHTHITTTNGAMTILQANQEKAPMDTLMTGLDRVVNRARAPMDTLMIGLDRVVNLAREHMAIPMPGPDQAVMIGMVQAKAQSLRGVPTRMTIGHQVGELHSKNIASTMDTTSEVSKPICFSMTYL